MRPKKANKHHTQTLLLVPCTEWKRAILCIFVREALKSTTPKQIDVSPHNQYVLFE